MDENEEFEFRLRHEREQSQANTQIAEEPAAPEGPMAFLKAITQYTPPVLGWKLNQKLNEQLDKAAYEAGGKVTDITGSPTAGMIANTAVQSLPMAIPVGAIAKGAAPLLEGGAKLLMQSALKPTYRDLRTGKAAQAVDTMLEQGLSPTNSGVEAIRNKATGLNKEAADLISQSIATVDKGTAASKIQDVVTRAERSNPTPQDSIAAIERVYDQFMSNGLVPKNMPVQQAQDLKQGIYRILKDKYGELGSDTVEAQKALGRGLREKIEQAVPDVVPINAEASKLWNTLNVAERRALMDANKDPVGMTFLAHNPVYMLGFWANRNAAFKSALAKMLYSGKEQIPAATARAGVSAYETGAQSKQDQQQ